MLTMNPYEVMTDPDLCGPWFSDPSWEPWKIFVKSVYALELTPEQLPFFQKHTGWKKPPTEQVRFPGGMFGRRGGKSEIGSFLGVHAGCFVDYSPYLAPGEVATVMLLAADRAQARNLMQYTEGFFRNVPLLGNMVEQYYRESIVLKNRVKIEIHTSDFGSVRGYTLAAVICDELAFWDQDADATLKALRPGLLTIPCSWLLVLSSPYAMRGPLWEMYSRHYGKEGSKTLVWKAPTLVMNPTADREQIAQEYESDPVGSAAEYGAEFRRDVVRFVTPEVVYRAVPEGISEREPDGSNGVMFVDSAGGWAQGDPWAIGIAKYEGGKSILLYAEQWKPPFSPAEVVRECCDTAKRYGISKAVGDRFATGFVHAEFEKNGVQYESTAKSKSELFAELLQSLNSGKCELLDNQVLIDQLLNLERKTGAGRDKIEAPKHAHDDLANAVAGALDLAGGASDLILLGNYGNISQTPKSLQYGAEEDERIQKRREEERERKRQDGDIFDQSLMKKKLF